MVGSLEDSTGVEERRGAGKKVGILFAEWWRCVAARTWILYIDDEGRWLRDLLYTSMAMTKVSKPKRIFSLIKKLENLAGGNIKHKGDLVGDVEVWSHHLPFSKPKHI
jgi:hypothetical protein